MFTHLCKHQNFINFLYKMMGKMNGVRKWIHFFLVNIKEKWSNMVKHKYMFLTYAYLLSA